MNVRTPELGCYTLPGQPESPVALLEEVHAAEELGLGTVFVSERWNIKEAAVLCGAAAAVSKEIQIATAATNHHTRHPVITAAIGMTMHRLTGGRFTLGLGRGVGQVFQALGLPPVTIAQMEDFAGLMRRLWRGELIVDHKGPAGSYPMLTLLGSGFDDDIPLGLTAWGPRTLALGGRAFDQVVLHTFFTDETLVRCVETVKRAAEEAGRDPDSVKVWSCLATVTEDVPEELRLKKVVARLAGYLQIPAYAKGLVAANQWDPARLEKFHQDEVVQSFGRSLIDGIATPSQLDHIATLLPDEWTAPAAYGSPQQCASVVKAQLDLGADGVIMHGATPSELAPVVAAYRS